MAAHSPVTRTSYADIRDSLVAAEKPKLLVIDELGYLPLERASAHVFFQLVTRRYERGSILLTTNQPVTEWGHVFGDEMIAAAEEGWPPDPQEGLITEHMGGSVLVS